MSEQLDGWHWVEWRNTLEPELFRGGRMQDHDGDWIMPAPTRKIGPRIPTPEELKATELKLAKLRNLADDLEKTLAETREERDRLRAEVERLRPKESGGWRFFLGGHGFRAVRHAKPGWYFDTNNKCAHEINSKTSDCLINNQRELTTHDAYASLAVWPEGQAMFREITGYEPPTCKESLPVQPEERVRCYLGRDGKLRCYDGYEECLFLDNNEDVHLAQPEQLTIDDGHKRVPLSEALEIVRDRPKQLAKLKEMSGIETPKDSVRCYRSNSGGVWVYGAQHDTYFSPYGGWDPAQSESITREYDIPCTITKARDMLADRPESLAEFDRITGIVDSVRCYRSNSGGVWVYGVQHNTYFYLYGDWTTAQPESTTLKNGDRCTIAEARDLLADRPKSLAEFDRITAGVEPNVPWYEIVAAGYPWVEAAS